MLVTDFTDVRMGTCPKCKAQFCEDEGGPTCHCEDWRAYDTEYKEPHKVLLGEWRSPAGGKYYRRIMARRKGAVGGVDG